MRAVAGILFALAGLQAQTLEVAPPRVMADQIAAVHARGLQPGERVTLRAELVDGADVRWVSKAEFVADAQGAIDTSVQAPVAGSYKEVSAMGPVWSMTPESNKAGRYQPLRDFGVQSIEFHLLRGNADGGQAQLQQVSLAEGVERVPVHEGTLRGLLFLPPGKEKHPGMLVLGGSEGGLPSRRAAWLAEHGFAALALAYFRYDDLPKELAGIPLESFGQALNWMAHRPEIASERLGVMGVSRGAELALQLGSMYPAIKAVVAYSPANVRNPACCGFTSVPYAWTWNGAGLAFRPLRGGPDQASRAVIDVENTKGPILLVSGDADRIWESSAMADSIVSRLKRAKFAWPYEHLKYQHAGHGAGRQEIVPSWTGEVRNPTSGRETEMGGTPRGNAESSLDSIPKVIEFLAKSLNAQPAR